MIKRVIFVVDLFQFIKGDVVVCEIFVVEFGKVFYEIGFVGVIGYGIFEKLINDFYKVFNVFFVLFMFIKEQYEIVGMVGQWGYIFFGKEYVKQLEVVDLKEFF